MRFFYPYISSLALVSCLIGGNAWGNSSGKILASIGPIYSLVRAIAGDSHDVDVLLQPHQSPHELHLQPNHLKKLHEAAIIFYAGPQVETFLPRALDALPSTTRIVSILEALGFKADLNAAAHYEDDHHEDSDYDNDHHDDLYDDHHEEDHYEDVHHRDFDEHEDSNKAAHNQDPHIWLSPAYGEKIIDLIVETLSAEAPEKAALYRSNAQKVRQNLHQVDKKIQKKLRSIRALTFIDLQNAFSHYGAYYKLRFAPITPVNHDSVSVASIRDIRKAARKSACILYEERDVQRLIDKIQEDTKINAVYVDPIAYTFKNRDHAYSALLEDVADKIIACALKKAA